MVYNVAMLFEFLMNVGIAFHRFAPDFETVFAQLITVLLCLFCWISA